MIDTKKQAVALIKSLTQTAEKVLKQRHETLKAKGFFTEYQHQKQELRRFVRVGSPEALQAEQTARYQIYPEYFEFRPKDHDNEPNRIADFKFDLDKDGDVATPIAEAHNIIDYFHKEYGVNPNEWRIWFSGGKGVHLELPASALGLEDGHPKLPLIYKQLARQCVEDLDLKTVDLSIYCMRSGKPFRREGIQRENGNYKVPVTLEELTIENHDSFIKAPRQLEDNRPGLRNEKLTAKIQEFINEIENTEAFTNSGAFFEYDFEEDPPCIAAIANNRRVTAGKCDFNLISMTLVRYARSRGLSCNDMVDQFRVFIMEFPSSSLGSSPQARESNVRARFFSMEAAGAEFGCGYARALGLPLGCEFCSYFDIELEQRKESFIDMMQKKFVERLAINQDLQNSDWVPLLLQHGLENESDLLATLKTRFSVANPSAALKDGLKRKRLMDLKERACSDNKIIVIDRPERSLVAEEIAQAIITKFEYRLIRCNGQVCYPRVGSEQ
jgi:hypothetical protein